jgi:hypothetical protein
MDCVGQPTNLTEVYHPVPSSIVPACATSYGYVIDRTSRKNVSMCSNQRMNGESDEKQESKPVTIYVSRLNQLQIVTKRHVNHKFIVRVEGKTVATAHF